MTPNIKNKVAILVRVSTALQSTDRQVSELLEYASAKSYDVVEVIQETISGSKKNHDRPAIQNVLKLAKGKRINKVLVSEVSRLGRSTGEVLQVLEELHANKVSIAVKNYELETLNQNGSVNSMAQFLLTILADISRMERATLIERINSGLDEAKRKGKTLGRRQGTTKPKSKMLTEYKQVIKCLKEGQTVRNTAKICEVGVSTVMRVKTLLKEEGTQIGLTPEQKVPRVKATLKPNAEPRQLPKS